MQQIFFVLPLLLAMALTPSPKDPMAAEFEKQVASIEKKTITDKRLDVFEVETTKSGTKWDVKGETTVAHAREPLIQAARTTFGNHLGRVDIRQLPDPALGDKSQALVRVSVAPMRKIPRHSAEMVDEVVMGTPVSLLKEEGGWFLIQTPYRYLGWVEKLMLVRLTSSEVDAWTASTDLARFSRPFGTVWAQPDQQEPISDIVLSCVVKTGPNQDGLTFVALPDGRAGFVPEDSLLPLAGKSGDKPKAAEIVRLALRLRGIPYLWGGNSSKGFDCSGFTQTLFRMNNVELPRDADQQAALGTPIQPSANFSNVQPGDLLFFGKDRITHVGLSLGGRHYIHASVDVHIQSLNPEDQDFDAGRRDTLKQIKRVIGE